MELSDLFSAIKSSIATPFHNEIVNFTEIACLSYDDLKSHIELLNEAINKRLDPNKRKITFYIDDNTDVHSFFWKTTVRIICEKFDVEYNKIESSRTFNLREFTRMYKSLQTQLTVANAINDEFETSTQSSHANGLLDDTTDDDIDANNCCICFERKPDLMLNCDHSYCSICLDKWNLNHDTCPMCRENISNSDEWVIENIPNKEEINRQVDDIIDEMGHWSDSDDEN